MKTTDRLWMAHLVRKATGGWKNSFSWPPSEEYEDGRKEKMRCRWAKGWCLTLQRHEPMELYRIQGGGGGKIMENNLEEKRRGLRQQENRQIIKKLFWRNPTKENETYINCRKQSDCLYLMFYSVFQMNEQQSLFTEEQSTTLQVSQWKWTLTREWLNFIWITGRFGVNNYSFSHRS